MSAGKWKVQGCVVWHAADQVCWWYCGDLLCAWIPHQDGGTFSMRLPTGHSRELTHVSSIEAAVSAGRAAVLALHWAKDMAPPAPGACRGGGGPS